MTNQASSGSIWTWLRTGWSWGQLAVEVAIGVVWLVTIASALSGEWPALTRWTMLLGVTGMAVSRRIKATHPRLEDPLFFAAMAIAVAGAWLGRQ
jgi:hypothetical protein